MDRPSNESRRVRVLSNPSIAQLRELIARRVDRLEELRVVERTSRVNAAKR
jgi:hypothetical protein